MRIKSKDIHFFSLFSIQQINKSLTLVSYNQEFIKKVHFLLKDQGMTINGVKKILNNNDSLKLDERQNNSIKTDNFKNKLIKISKLLKKIKEIR